MTDSNDNITIPTWTIAKGIKWATGISFATFLIPWFSSHLADEEELIQGIAAFIALVISTLLCTWIVWKRSSGQSAHLGGREVPLRSLYWKPLKPGCKEKANLLAMLVGYSLLTTSLIYIMNLASANLFYPLIKIFSCSLKQYCWTTNASPTYIAALFIISIVLGTVLLTFGLILNTYALQKHLSQPLSILYRERDLAEIPKFILIGIGAAFLVIGVSPSFATAIVSILNIPSDGLPIEPVVSSLCIGIIGVVIILFSGFPANDAMKQNSHNDII